jgi:hypothetical protein
MAATSSGSLVQGNFGAVGNFQLVVPSTNGGLRHYWRDNNAAGFPWTGPEFFASGFAGGASIIQSNFGVGLGNFEVILQEGGRLAHYWREDAPPFRWLGPIYFGGGVSGNPAFIQDRFGVKGNFDVVVPLQGGGIAHYWRDNDDAAFPWTGPIVFGQALGQVDAVALIQSTMGNPGNLEVVARVDDQLFHLWRDSDPAFTWSAPAPVPLNGLPANTKPSGIPGLLQGTTGVIGNLELVTPLSTGGIGHLTRDNNAAGFPWSAATRFGNGNAISASVIESDLGAGGAGNLEVVALVGETVAHYSRNAAGVWQGPILAAAVEVHQDPAVFGEWQIPFHSGVVGIQANVIHTGKVLFYTFKDPWNDVNMALGECTVMDPITGEIVFMPMNYDLFCAGPVHLADGRIFVAGGQNEAFHQTHTFTPAGDGGTWQFTGDMSGERWYATCTELADGRIHIISGTKTGPEPNAPLAGPEPDSPLNDLYEIYDPAVGILPAQSAAFLNQASPYALYPHVYLLPGGELMIQAELKTWFFRVDTQQLDGPIANASAHPRTYPLGAGGVMLPLLPNTNPPYRARVMMIGGGKEPLLITTPASAECEILDLGVANPAWQMTAPLAHARVMPDVVLLPDSTVLATNGSASGFADNMEEPVYETELYDPATDTWTTLATMRVPRLYHATALLLPDARVLTAGTDGTFNPEPFNIPNTRVEIFTPPYLFKGPRPVVENAPAGVAYGQAFAVRCGPGQGASIASAVFMRPGSTTHGVNMDQRAVGLTITARAGDTLTLEAPPLPGIAPPGFYMLFLLNNQGVPSVAKFVHLE